MWQEVLAVDSRLCAARKMDKDLRPLYLKRRMQLIKAAEDEYEASQLGQVRERLPEDQYAQHGGLEILESAWSCSLHST